MLLRDETQPRSRGNQPVSKSRAAGLSDGSIDRTSFSKRELRCSRLDNNPAGENPSGYSPSIVAAPSSVREAKLGLERADLYLPSNDKSYRGRGNRKPVNVDRLAGSNLTPERQRRYL